MKKENKEQFIDYHFKTHGLIYSSMDLTSRMMDIFALMLTEMRKDDWLVDGKDTVPEYRFSKDQLCTWFNVDGKHLSTCLKAPSEKLAKKTIGFEDDTGKFAYFPVLSKVSYDNQELVIKPNGDLRDLYIINSHKAGHAKIDNQIFRSLVQPSAKRVFEFLARYRTNQNEMYFISIAKLQILFGVKSNDGKVIKKTYASESQFIKRLIEPALQAIAENPAIADKLEILERDGKLGYELTGGKQGKKIRFLVRWADDLSESERLACFTQIQTLMKQKVQLETIGSNDDPDNLNEILDVLKQLKDLLVKVGEKAMSERIDREIESLREQIAEASKEEELQKLESSELEVKSMFSQLFKDN